MNNSIWWNRIAFSLLLLGVVTLGFSLTLQPKISDDWYLIWNYQDSTRASSFIVLEYTQLMGRVWGILLLVALAWYCALGPGAWSRTRENHQAMGVREDFNVFKRLHRCRQQAQEIATQFPQVKALLAASIMMPGEDSDRLMRYQTTLEKQLSRYVGELLQLQLQVTAV